MPRAIDSAAAAASDDQRLLAALAAGDRSALERIYRAHKDDLLTILAHLTGDPGASEDVLHDVFVSLARKAKRLRVAGSLRRYLAATCVNRARDIGKRRRPDTAEPESFTGHRAPEPDPAARAAREDETSRAVAAMARLPAEQREVVTLHLHGGLTFREIGDLLSTSINTVQSRYRYALTALRRSLVPEEDTR